MASSHQVFVSGEPFMSLFYLENKGLKGRLSRTYSSRTAYCIRDLSFPFSVNGADTTRWKKIFESWDTIIYKTRTDSTFSDR
jgi:hypothetical protein